MSQQNYRTTVKHKAFRLQFWLLCLSSFLFFSSFNMIIPELPDYLTSMGGEDYKGLIISLFTLAAGLSRPFSGKLADTIGRIPVMVIGAGVCFVIGFLYPMISSIAGFFLLRFFHGFSTGFKPTGTSAYIADIAPFDRRGEAMGISGVFGTLGIASGPVVGGFIAMHYSLDVLFYASSALALLSIAILLGMKETLQNKQTFKLSLLKLKRKDILEPKVIGPSLVMMFSTYSYGVVLTIVPDFSVALGIENKGLFFAAFTAASILVRLVSRRISDRYGRVVVLKASTFLLVLAMVLVGTSSTFIEFMIYGALFGMAAGMNSPTIMAWTIDLSDPEHKGRAMASMFIALEVGIGIGALITGALFNNEVARIPLVFNAGAFFAALAFLYIQFIYKPAEKNNN